MIPKQEIIIVSERQAAQLSGLVELLVKGVENRKIRKVTNNEDLKIQLRLLLQSVDRYDLPLEQKSIYETIAAELWQELSTITRAN